MTSNHFFKFLVILAVIGWSVFEAYPPTGTNLIDHFAARAVTSDSALTNILTKARALDQQNPLRTYGNLFDAIETNDIRRYFPFFDQAASQKNPTTYILNRLERESAGKIKLGLDLRGGTSFLIGMDTQSLTNVQTRDNALSQAVEVLRRRVDKFGVAEPVIQPVGEDRILIQLPGLTEEARASARRQIEKAAFLEFRMVHESSDALLAQGLSAPGYEKLPMAIKSDNGSKMIHYYLVKRQAEEGLIGKYVTRAGVVRHPATGMPEIHFELDADGAEKFARITRKYSPKDGQHYQLAIVLDGELTSAPRIMGPIEGGRGQISGDFDLKEAIELANTLENPLEAQVTVLEERSVDPSLGSDTIKSGVQSAIYGTIAVAVFMLVYYLLAGVVASIAMIINLIIMLGVMCSINTTLTLPGIAGIVLTIGMAVDANVLIYERIREELAKGKSLRGAISAGYDRAFWTIFDSNITTLIASVILIYLGTGPIKGFGVTLTIGVLVSMFTALVVTRLIFDFLLAKNLIKSLPMMHIIKGSSFQFMKYAKPAFALSWAVIIIGLVFGTKRLGIDFAGGDSVLLDFKQKVAVEDITKTLEAAGMKDPRIGYQKDLKGAQETLRITTPAGTGDTVVASLTKAFPNAGFKGLQKETVGATVGDEIMKTALIAIMASLFLILVYVAVRYEVSFAFGAVLAVLHDVLMTIGIYCLAGREMNTTFVAAILTIIGFSINDTIVIFDRIREDLKLGVRGTFTQLINQALNETLSRTIITSGTVFIATIALYIFGGGAINDFAFTFLVGILTGTYSSIYIASALVLWWHKGERPKSSEPLPPSTTVVVEGGPAPAGSPSRI